jgi:hypothetical protein
VLYNDSDNTEFLTILNIDMLLGQLAINQQYFGGW